MRSKLFLLNARDFLKGLVLAIITAVMTFLINELQTGAPIDYELAKRVGVTALIAFMSYVVKNFLTNSEGQLLTAEKS